jgi:hypothetical protein
MKKILIYGMILTTAQNKILIILTSLLVAYMLTGCRDLTKYENSYIIEGSMHFRDIEGGCWQLVDGNNQSYEIVGENVDEVRIDGLTVKLLVRDQENRASICMVGRIVELIEIIETSQPN